MIETEQHDSDEQEQRELEEYDDAARQQGDFAVALVFCRQETLDDQLIHAVTRRIQKRAADDAAPERIGQIKIQRKIPDRHLGARDCHHSLPATRNQSQNYEKSHQRAAQINKQLDDIGPNNRSQPAFKSVQKVRAEIIRMDQTSPEPRTMLTTMATAKTLTPSARARVTRNMLAVACLVEARTGAASTRTRYTFPL